MHRRDELHASGKQSRNFPGALASLDVTVSWRFAVAVKPKRLPPQVLLGRAARVERRDPQRVVNHNFVLIVHELFLSKNMFMGPHNLWDLAIV